MHCWRRCVRDGEQPVVLLAQLLPKHILSDVSEAKVRTASKASLVMYEWCQRMIKMREVYFQRVSTNKADREKRATHLAGAPALCLRPTPAGELRDQVGGEPSPEPDDSRGPPEGIRVRSARWPRRRA